MSDEPEVPAEPRRRQVDGTLERLRAATEHLVDAGPLETLPSRLAEVCAAVLQVDGVGLSVMTEQYRIPLGASNAAATDAERFQFTAQQGPCWEAIGVNAPLAANADMIAVLWPHYFDDLRTRTPFRSVASVPLRIGGRPGGAVDLYFTDPTAATGLDLGAANAAAAHIADTLYRTAHDIGTDSIGIVGPRWFHGPTAQARTAVWIATGILIASSDNTASDAIALLRAYAYSAGRTLDDVTADLVSGRVSADEILR